MAKNTVKAFGEIGAGIGRGMVDTLLGTDFMDSETRHTSEKFENEPGNFQKTVEFKRLYDFNAEQEKRTIQELLKKIHEEIKALKQANALFAEEVKDVEKLTLSSVEEQEGIYHIRFLELMLSFIKTLHAKVSESSTWLEALQSKKKKRGSLFASLSKKKGTQYSMSEEMKITRSTQ